MSINDLISRSDIKEHISELLLVYNGEELANAILNAIDNAEAVAPEKPQGEWIRKVDKAGFISHICSECGAEIEVEDPKDDKFCFNCGAEMKGGADMKGGEE